MQNKKVEKALIEQNTKSILYKIKKFFLSLFKRNENSNHLSQAETVEKNNTINDKQNAFMEYIKNTKNEENEVLKLQKQYEMSKANKIQLTSEQILALSVLYKKQINELEKYNANRKQKIMQHKNGETILRAIENIGNKEINLFKLQEQYEKGEIESSKLSIKQKRALIDLYKQQIREMYRYNTKKKQKLLEYRKSFKIAE